MSSRRTAVPPPLPESRVQRLLARLRRDPAKIPPAELTITARGRKVALLSRQLASMVAGGVSVSRSLDILGEQTEDPVLAHAVTDVGVKVAQGYTLSKAASLYGNIFPTFFVHLMATGESTGRLVKVIERLADLLEREENLSKQVRGALSYPLFIAVLTFFLTLGLFSTVLPSFADFYSDFDVDLPAITSFLMKLTAICQSPWTWIAMPFMAYALVWLVRRSWADPDRQRLMFAGLVAIPLTGPILSQSTLARYCWVMELTADAGLDLMRSLRLAAMASGNPLLQADSTRLVRGVSDGDSLTSLFGERPDLYPSLLHQMVLLGEETSQYAESFGRAANWFEQEVETRIEGFQAALEPILMGGIAFLVGGIVLSVFLPLYGLLDKLGV